MFAGSRLCGQIAFFFFNLCLFLRIAEGTHQQQLFPGGLAVGLEQRLQRFGHRCVNEQIGIPKFHGHRLKIRRQPVFSVYEHQGAVESDSFRFPFQQVMQRYGAAVGIDELHPFRLRRITGTEPLKQAVAPVAADNQQGDYRHHRQKKENIDKDEDQLFPPCRKMAAEPW